MKKYLSFFRIRFINSLQYRAAALGGIATQFTWGFLYLLMFQAFYRSDPSAIPMPFEQLASYVWLQQGFLMLYMTFRWDGTIVDGIVNGNIAYDLVRPVDTYGMWLSRDLATRFSGALLRFIPIAIITPFLPSIYKLRGPINLTAFLLFVVSLALTTLLASSLIMLQYAIISKTLSPLGIRHISIALIDFLSGALIPIPFFPDWFRPIAEFLPFASLQDAPFRIYIGHITGGEAIYRVCLQLFWIVIITAISKLMLSRSLKRVVVQGG